MATEYKIYLINLSTSTQQFWCFLERPEELVSDPQVFANSSVSLAVPANSPATNTFTIPVQYVTGAGASNNAVGLNVQIDSSIELNAELDDQFLATYADAPPNMGPLLEKTGTGAGGDQISIESNAFNKGENEIEGWFSNMSFGIQTAQGFIGMTWSPDPSKTQTLTPKLAFYVAVGDYGSNTMADWTTVSNDSAEISVPDSFELNNTTVTYTATGEWEVTPGEPSADALAAASSVIRTQRLLSKAYLQLAENAGLKNLLAEAEE